MSRAPYVVSALSEAIADGATADSAAFSTVQMHAVGHVAQVVGVDGTWTYAIQESADGSTGWVTITGLSWSGDFGLSASASMVAFIKDTATRQPYLRAEFALGGGALSTATACSAWLPQGERVEGLGSAVTV